MISILNPRHNSVVTNHEFFIPVHRTLRAGFVSVYQVFVKYILCIKVELSEKSLHKHTFERYREIITVLIVRHNSDTFYPSKKSEDLLHSFYINIYFDFSMIRKFLIFESWIFFSYYFGFFEMC